MRLSELQLILLTKTATIIDHPRGFLISAHGKAKKTIDLGAPSPSMKKKSTFAAFDLHDDGGKIGPSVT